MEFTDEFEWEENQMKFLEEEQQAEDLLIEMMVDYYDNRHNIDPDVSEEDIPMINCRILKKMLGHVINHVVDKYDDPIIKEWANDLLYKKSKDTTLREVYFLLDLAQNEPYNLALYDLYNLHRELNQEWVYDVIPTFEFPDSEDTYPF